MATAALPAIAARALTPPSVELSAVRRSSAMPHRASVLSTKPAASSVFAVSRSAVSRATKGTKGAKSSDSEEFAADDVEAAAEAAVEPEFAEPEKGVKVEKPEVPDVSEAVEAVEDVAKDIGEAASGTGELKLSLLDAIYGTKRGFRASSETRAEIAEIVGQLEAKNPTEAPSEETEKFNGKWLLAYTSFSELSPLLAVDFPLIKIGEISQTVNSVAQIITNSVTIEGPVSTSTIQAQASFEVRSPKRIQVKFEEAVVGSPEMTTDLEVPTSTVIMGERVDLSPLQPLLRPLQEAGTSLIRLLSGQPPLKFPIRNGKASSSWLLTTYLDDELRISRGDGGSLFVLVKEGSKLAAY